MASWFQKCEGCKKKRLYIKKRVYYTKEHPQGMKSQSELCGNCFKAIDKILNGDKAY